MKKTKSIPGEVPDGCIKKSLRFPKSNPEETFVGIREGIPEGIIEDAHGEMTDEKKPVVR